MRDSVVRDRLADVDPALREQVLAGAGAAAIDAELARLGAVRCFQLEVSIGALFGVELAHRRRAALKLHQRHISADDLRAVQQVQRHLVANGFPCPRPLIAPTPFLGRLATGEEWRDEGAFRDDVDDATRRTMAALLARQIDLCSELPAAGVLTWVPPERLWPTPHNALFDFEATAGGAEWIDDIARAARAGNRAGPRVLAHQDWSVKHFRFRGDEVTVVYDWDSVFCDNESISVGAAAATHTAALDVPTPWTPSVDDAAAFLDDYARARPLDDETRAAAAAHAVYTVAYTARCEHALDTRGTVRFVTGARAVVRDFAEALL